MQSTSVVKCQAALWQQSCHCAATLGGCYSLQHSDWDSHLCVEQRCACQVSSKNSLFSPNGGEKDKWFLNQVTQSLCITESQTGLGSLPTQTTFYESFACGPRSSCTKVYHAVLGVAGEAGSFQFGPPSIPALYTAKNSRCLLGREQLLQ